MPTNTILRYAATLVILISIVFLLSQLKVLLVPVFFSLLFSVMLFPICRRMVTAGFARGVSALMSVFVMTLLFASLFFMLFRQLGNLHPITAG